MRKPDPPAIARYLAVLEETPGRFQALQERLSEAESRQSPAPGQWSALQILAHLRACQEVWGETIGAMLRHDRPELPYYHPREWVKRKGYNRLPFSDSLVAFSTGRQELLRLLSDLDQEAWLRPAVIKSREHTVFSQVRRMALHEESHWPQLESLCPS